MDVAKLCVASPMTSERKTRRRSSEGGLMDGDVTTATNEAFIPP